MLDLRISGYIDKPLDECRIFKVLDKIMPNLKKLKDTVTLKTENGDMQTVRINNIVYIKTENKLVEVMTRTGKMRYMGKYEELSMMIENYDFLKIRMKCMVNMQYTVIIKDETVQLKCDKKEYRENITRSIDKNDIRLKWLNYRRRFGSNV